MLLNVNELYFHIESTHVASFNKTQKKLSTLQFQNRFNNQKLKFLLYINDGLENL